MRIFRGGGSCAEWTLRTTTYYTIMSTEFWTLSFVPLVAGCMVGSGLWLVLHKSDLPQIAVSGYILIASAVWIMIPVVLSIRSILKSSYSEVAP